MAGRVFRFALRLAKDGIDHRTLSDAWRLYQWEMERRERERREPRPRPLPYVQPEEPEDHGTAIPRAPRFSAHALGTGAALAHRRWVLLSPLVAVSDSTELELEFLYDAPPRPSTMYIHASATDETAVHHIISVDGEGGVLLVRATDRATDRAGITSYLVCNMSTRTATPVPATLAQLLQSAGSLGVIRFQDRVLLVEMEEGQQDDAHATLRIISIPNTAEPFIQEIAAPYPEGAPRPWGGHGVLTQGGRMHFVDRTTGVMRYDPDAPGALELVPFPAALAGQEQSRYVGVSEDAITLAEIHEGRLRTWILSEQWEESYLVSSMTSPTVPALLPVPGRVGFMHPLEAHTLYLFVVSSQPEQLLIVRADMEVGTMSLEWSIPASASVLIAMELH